MLPIGDTLWLAPTTRALRERYPQARITALTRRETASLAACLPGVDDTLTFTAPRSLVGLRATLRLLGVLRARRYGWALTFTSPAYKWISLLAGIRRRTYLPFDRLWWLIPGRHARWRATHATEHYYDAARPLGLPPWREVDRRPTVSLPASAQDEATRFLQAHAALAEPAAERRLIAVHPGGAGLDGQKRWPAERFAALCARLWREQGICALLLGGPDERALAAQVAEQVAALAPNARPIVAAGELSLLGAFALIARCTLFIGDDSGLLHAAAAMGVPYVGAFGPTSLASFHPIPRQPQQGRLVTPHPPCPELVTFVGGEVFWRSARCPGAVDAMQRISVAQIYAACVALLAQQAQQTEASASAASAR